jgi:hypothetical protein
MLKIEKRPKVIVQQPPKLGTLRASALWAELEPLLFRMKAGEMIVIDEEAAKPFKLERVENFIREQLKIVERMRRDPKTGEGKSAPFFTTRSFKTKTPKYGCLPGTTVIIAR